MKLSELAEHLKGRAMGEAEISSIASLESARAHDLVFVEDEKNLAAALSSSAGAVIAGEFAARTPGKPMIICPQPRLAFAGAAALLHPAGQRKPGTHPTAIVHPSAKVGEGAAIAAYVVVEENAVVGDNSHIGAGTFIGAGAKLGPDCVVYPNVTIYAGAILGARVIVHAGAVLGSDGFGYVRDKNTGRYEKFPQVGRLEIGDDVEVGANVTIDRGALDATIIGRGVKLDNLVHVAHNVIIGENVVIAAQTGVSGSVVIEDNVIVAGQVGIADHVRIEEGVILGAQCGVPSNKVVRGKGILFWGTPARPIREYLKELAVLARLAKK